VALGGAAFALAAASPRAASATRTEELLAQWMTPSLSRPDARLVVERIEAPSVGCQPAWSSLATPSDSPRDGYGVTQPLAASGRVAVVVPGTRDAHACRAWIWARVRVFAKVPVTTRPLHAGESLAGAWALREVELRPGFVAWEPTASDALADRSLPSGQGVAEDMVRRAGLAAGQPVKVLLLTGALSVETSATVVPCGRTKTCAVLASGRHIEGAWEDGRLVVRTP
jgi:hypothetical protein